MSRKQSVSRRAFLQLLGGSVSTVALASCMPAMPPAMPDDGADNTGGTGNEPPMMDGSTMREVNMMGQTIPVRRSISSLEAMGDDDPDQILATYAQAVQMMMDLPEEDPRSWSRQMQIHLDHCPHGNWFFLPWHAAYLYYFEEICRELTGNDAFALPYWNWSITPQIPATFWGDESNPLFNNTRRAGPEDTVPESFVSTMVIEDILSIPTFEEFASGRATAQRQRSTSGELESTPHNFVHGWVGGNMGTFMSPLDPIFWMHHNMIECCWNDWIDRGNANTVDPVWLDFEFVENFVDRQGNPVTIGVRDVLELQVSSYTFDSAVKGNRTRMQNLVRLRAAFPEMTELTFETFEKAEKQGVMMLNANQSIIETVDVDANVLGEFLNQKREDRLVLTLGNLEHPVENDTFVEVAINTSGEPRQMAVDETEFVSTIAFFNDPSHEGHNNSTFSVDITDNIRNLHAEGKLTDLNSIDIQLTAIPLDSGNSKTNMLAVDSLELDFKEQTLIRHS
ncbi:MAG: tyrosinase family protein [Chloroflexota bacterium]